MPTASQRRTLSQRFYGLAPNLCKTLFINCPQFCSSSHIIKGRGHDVGQEGSQRGDRSSLSPASLATSLLDHGGHPNGHLGFPFLLSSPIVHLHTAARVILKSINQISFSWLNPSKSFCCTECKSRTPPHASRAPSRHLPLLPPHHRHLPSPLRLSAADTQTVILSSNRPRVFWLSAFALVFSLLRALFH